MQASKRKFMPRRHCLIKRRVLSVLKRLLMPSPQGSIEFSFKKNTLVNFGPISRSGFTLLEVMVALAIFATAAVALTKLGMQYTQSTAHAILRTKAQFVASNEIAMMEINQDWLEGTSSKRMTQQGETWQVDKAAKPTISPDIQRIDVQVSLINPETGKVESGVTNLVFFNPRFGRSP